MKIWIVKLPRSVHDETFVRDNIATVLANGGVIGAFRPDYYAKYVALTLPDGVEPNSALKDIALTWQELTTELVATITRELNTEEEEL